MTEITLKYGFKLDQIVITKLDLWDENNGFIPAGSKIRLVAFVPKSYRTKYVNEYNDNKKYFYNAVVATQDKSQDYKNRIRANFCTIKK